MCACVCLPPSLPACVPPTMPRVSTKKTVKGSGSTNVLPTSTFSKTSTSTTSSAKSTSTSTASKLKKSQDKTGRGKAGTKGRTAKERKAAAAALAASEAAKRLSGSGITVGQKKAKQSPYEKTLGKLAATKQKLAASKRKSPGTGGRKGGAGGAAGKTSKKTGGRKGSGAGDSGTGTGGKRKPGPKAGRSKAGAKSKTGPKTGSKTGPKTGGKTGPKTGRGPNKSKDGADGKSSKAASKPRSRQPKKTTKTPPASSSSAAGRAGLGTSSTLSASKQRAFPTIVPLLDSQTVSMLSSASRSGSSLLDKKGKGSASAAARKSQAAAARKRKAAAAAAARAAKAKGPASFQEPIVNLQSPELALPRTNVTMFRSIVFGTLAFALTPEQGYTEYKTHQWYVYVRGLECEDLSYFIKSVTFSLHPSFTPPVRTIEKPPYEIMEYGWGEFSIGIRIHFQDPTLAPVDQVHMLKLYPPATIKPSSKTNPKKPVLNERYDEIVFKDPPTHFYEKLLGGPKTEVPRHPLTDYFNNYNFSEIKDLKRIREAQAYVDRELANVKSQLEMKIKNPDAFEAAREMEAAIGASASETSLIGGTSVISTVDDDMAELGNLLA